MAEGRRRAEAVMGMPIVIDVRDRDVEPGALDRAFAWLRRVDARFSTYDPGSEISRLGRGELAPADAHPDVRDVLARCEELRRRTDGYFDARAPLGGAVDPTGLVKGWAVDRLVEGLEAAGARNFCVDAGGDLRLRGGPAPGEPWRVGIRHPREPDRVAAVLALDDAAVATSGTYERGAHIVDPHTGRPPSGVLAVTVVGTDLATADALATAVFAMGEQGPAWAALRPGCAVMSILAGDRVLSTPAFVARCAGASVADSLRRRHARRPIPSPAVRA